MDPMGTKILDWMIFAKIVILKGRLDNPMPGEVTRGQQEGYINHPHLCTGHLLTSRALRVNVFARPSNLGIDAGMGQRMGMWDKLMWRIYRLGSPYSWKAHI